MLKWIGKLMFKVVGGPTWSGKRMAGRKRPNTRLDKKRIDIIISLPHLFFCEKLLQWRALFLTGNRKL